jgi:hypothetical protein
MARRGGHILLFFVPTAPPAPPDGFVYLLGADGAYLTGADGNYLLGVA